jgi:Ferritin-like domain
MTTRRELIAGGAAALAAGPLVARAAAQGGDRAVLGLLLAVEQAQVALYEQAAASPFRGQVAGLIGRFGDEERKHAARLRDLGAPDPGPAPAGFDFRDQDAFLRLAQRLEGLAVGAYNGAIPQLRGREAIEAVASIAQVEARHSAAIRVLRESEPAPRGLDRAYEPARAERALQTLLGG